MPEPFELPRVSDARIEAIAVRVEPVPFDRVAAAHAGEQSRTRLAVDGREAVRTERRTRAALYPNATPASEHRGLALAVTLRKRLAMPAVICRCPR